MTGTRNEGDMGDMVPRPMDLPSLEVDQDPAIGNINPATGEPLDPVRFSSEQEVFWAVNKARRAQESWCQKPFEERAHIVEAFVDKLVESRKEGLRRIQMETGRSYTDALVSEFGHLAAYMKSVKRVAKEALRPEHFTMNHQGMNGKKVDVIPVPRGVVGIIGSWTFPLATFYKSLFPALLAGNGVVIKPSEYAPRTGAFLFEAARKTLPPDLLTLVQGDPKVANSLFSAGIDAVAFAGPISSGLRISHLASQYLIPSAIELGGCDPAIVLADCELERTVAGITQYALVNAGQNQACIEVVYVEEVIADTFVDQLVKYVKALKVSGDGHQEADIGPLQSAGQVTQVLKQIKDAVSKGASLRAGGRRIGQGYGFEPTILDHCNESMEVVAKATVGPVIAICRIPPGEDVLNHVKKTPFGVNGSVWTTDLERGRRIAEQLDVGVALVNNHALTSSLAEAPWPGGKGMVGPSGRQAYNTFVKFKTILVDSSHKPESWWFPIDTSLRQLVDSSFKKKRRLRGLSYWLAARRRRLATEKFMEDSLTK